MMHTRSPSLTRQTLIACVLGACLGSPVAMAANGGSSRNSDIQAQYRMDVERCKSGQTNQDRATCLREAGAALEEARRNRLARPDNNFDQNKTARCNALPAEAREDCMIQMSGQNTTVEGSIGGGGILRETTITVPGSTTQGATSTYSTTPAPGVAPPMPAPGLTPNPPSQVPAPTLAPGSATPAAPAPAPRSNGMRY